MYKTQSSKTWERLKKLVFFVTTYTKQEAYKTYLRLWCLSFIRLALAANRAVKPTVCGRNHLCRTMSQNLGSFNVPSYRIHCIVLWYIGKNRI